MHVGQHGKLPSSQSLDLATVRLCRSVRMAHPARAGTQNACGDGLGAAPAHCEEHQEGSAL